MEFESDDDLLAAVLSILDNDSEPLSAITSPRAQVSCSATTSGSLERDVIASVAAPRPNAREQLDLPARWSSLAPACVSTFPGILSGNAPPVPLAIAASSSSAGKKPRRTDPNKARNARTRELKALRDEASTLSRELAALRCVPSHRRQVLEGAARKQSLAVATGSARPQMWEEICRHQFELRMRAERENARLKSIVDEQVKAVASLKRQLQKPAKQLDAEAQRGSTSKRIYSLPSDSEIDEAIFKQLLADVDACYLDMEHVFALNGLSFSSGSVRDARMRDGEHGRYVDFISSHLLPFTFGTTTEVLWDFYSGMHKHRGPLYYKTAKKLNTSNDIIMEKFALELLSDNTRADFLTRQIVRKYVEGDVVKVVWVCTVEPIEFNNKPFSGCAYQEKGYVACKKADLVGVVDPPTCTHLLRCHRVVPYITHDPETVLSNEQKKEIGALMEFTLGLDSITSGLECIQDMLLRMSLRDQRDWAFSECIVPSG